MEVYCIVWCCHLLTVQESGDQSLSSFFLLFFFSCCYHSSIVLKNLKKKKTNLKKKEKKEAVILTAIQLFNCCLDKPLFCLKDFKLIPHFFNLVDVRALKRKISTAGIA